MKKIITYLLAISIALGIVTHSFAEEKETAKSTTRIYLDAYIPGLTEEAKLIIETLVSEYSKEPESSPAGSGKVWANIRKIGEAMGVEADSKIDMQAGIMTVIVSKAGITYFKDCSEEVQNQIIELVSEAAEAVNLTPAYKNGIFTLTKANEVRLKLQLKAIKNGWIKEKDNKIYYWVNDILQKNKIIQINSKCYIVDKNGVKQTGSKFVNLGSKKYYISNDVIVKNKWIKLNSKYYRAGVDGVIIVNNLVKLDSKWYIVDKNGVKQTGSKFVKLGSKTYYISKNLVVKNKWIKLNNKYYRAGVDGVIIINKKLKIDNKLYNFNSNGVCVNK